MNIPTPLIVEKIVLDMNTGRKRTLFATVQNDRDENHFKFSLTFEGWISKWTEK